MSDTPYNRAVAEFRNLPSSQIRIRATAARKARENAMSIDAPPVSRSEQAITGLAISFALIALAKVLVTQW